MARASEATATPPPTQVRAGTLTPEPEALSASASAFRARVGRSSSSVLAPGMPMRVSVTCSSPPSSTVTKRSTGRKPSLVTFTVCLPGLASTVKGVLPTTSPSKESVALGLVVPMVSFPLASALPASSPGMAAATSDCRRREAMRTERSTVETTCRAFRSTSQSLTR